MQTFRVLTVVGARPQFIKASVVSQAMRDWAQGWICEIMLHTGQHYDFEMSQVFFDGLKLDEPDIHLECGGGSHAEQTAKMIVGIDEAVSSRHPHAIMVYGDTNSTLAGALVAAKRNIPLIHVEAGCRSFNRTMPEETNRIVADSLSKVLLCASSVDMENLQREGIGIGKSVAGLHLVGDVMYDLAKRTSEEIAEEPAILEKLGLEPGSYLYTTVHRSENTDDAKRLEEIFAGLTGLVDRGLPVVLPLHPRTKKMLETYFGGLPNLKGLHLIEPVSYLTSIGLVKYSKAVLTDSGGLQKEAYYLGKYCVTLRDETEWTQLVDAGLNSLSGADRGRIIEEAQKAVGKDWPEKVPGLYGGGIAGPYLVEAIVNELCAIYGEST